VALLLGGPIEDNKEKAAQASPITFVSKDDPPFFICHGDQDQLVPPNQSVRLDAALRKVGVESTLIIVKGAGHGFDNNPEVEKMTTEFFDKHLR
jgi:dipeptidyl aminopeptidase/acylaminoacyl peptidase